MTVIAQSQAAEPTQTNRLAGETSPYLLQHAHNPVDWYPWGPAALERARREQKPIFLSIGYAACHWCHVMEHESFEDRATAEMLNRHFVCIKVDREERPDLDEIYMAAVQLMTGSGGWPLSVFLTPDLKPFFGGTYFPPADRPGLPAFRTLLARLADLWEHRRADLLGSADRVAQAVRDHAEGAGGGVGPVDRDLPERAVQELTAAYDTRWGGFGSAPKFPPTAALALLLRRYARTRQAGLLPQVTFTLDRMAAGGIHDQLGGGFHRYAVDAHWLVPHFEKMLYDNALLAGVYLEAWQVTGAPRYRRVALSTLDYVLRDLAAPQGGFCSSQDADSEGQEGRYYVWTPAEIDAVLGGAGGALFGQFYGVDARGNFEGRSILHVPRELELFARDHQRDAVQLEHQLDAWRAQLLASRARRPPPGRDDKVLTAWNALAISALARVGRACDVPRYLQAADRAADFLLTHRYAAGRLLRTGDVSRGGQAAYLDDYALLVNALLDLYETTREERRLAAADELAQHMLTLFRDDQAGGFFMTSAAHTHLLVRPKPAYDGQEPSGNSAAARALWRLGRLLDKPDCLQETERTLKAFTPAMRQAPLGFLGLLGVLDGYCDPGPEIVIVGAADAPDTRALWQEVYRRYLPGSVLAGYDPAQSDAAALARRSPLLTGRQAIHDQATVYVCRHYACQQPVQTVAALRDLLP